MLAYEASGPYLPIWLQNCAHSRKARLLWELDQTPRNLFGFLNVRQPLPEGPQSPEDRANARRHLQFSAFVPALLVVVLWLIHAMAWALGSDWSFLGVLPRHWGQLWHIFSAPLIHGDWAHLAANSLPLFVLGFLLLYSYRKVALPTLVLVWVLSGLGVWLLGRPATHIGASGVVFGINFFLFFSGIFRMDLRSLALSLLVAFAYGGMVWGVFPSDPHISFEAHASGAAIGTLAAYLFRNVDRPPLREWDEDEEGLVPQGYRGENGPLTYHIRPQTPGADPAASNPSHSAPPARRDSGIASGEGPRVIRLRYRPQHRPPQPGAASEGRSSRSDPSSGSSSGPSSGTSSSQGA